jgi:PKD repeat protein
MCEVRSYCKTIDRSVMSKPQYFRCFPLAAAIGCALTLGVATSSALAAGSPWGELRRFGPTGKAALTVNGTTNAFGVDPKTNDVFVGDEPEREGKYRLQELDGEGKPLGSVLLSPKNVLGAEKLRGNPAGIEGVAVDSAHERVYVLVVYERAEATAAQESKGEEPIDEDELDAGVLYAFSTKANAGKLEPAMGATAEGVLATPATLKAQGESFGESLLESTGITVDPTDGDVIALGEVEQPGETRHLAAQRISSAGTAGARWVDPTEAGEEETDGGLNSEESNSPVVSASGQVYVEQFDKVVQIPSSFASTDPTLVFALPPEEALLQLGAARANTAFGGGLSIVPGAPGGGTLYASTLIQEAGGTYYLGALQLQYADGAADGSASELGWTGGGSVAHGPECIISVEGPRPQLAAGKEGHVLIFDPHVDQVIEFGPGGKGCPTARASTPSMTVGGTPLKEVGGVAEVPAGTAVALSSTVTQAKALSVKWDYDEGEGPQAGSAAGQLATGTHKFAKIGELTVKGMIATDDLATPTIAVEKKIKVTQSPPSASFTAGSAGPGESVAFNASSSSDPNHAAITEYAWNFGDGHEEVTSEPITHHVYATADTYSVTLTVTDALRLKGTKTSSVVIAVPPPKTGGGGGSTPLPAPPPPPPPPSTGVKSTGAGGVLSYSASLASTSLTVTPAGAFVVKVNCLGKSSCSGTVTLSTLTAVVARAVTSKKKKKSKAAILTLASGSFSLAGGQGKAVTLHLSSKARKLLARSHVLRARATILARDVKGITHTTQLTVTLRAAKPKHH